MLIEAEVVNGRTLTSFPSLAKDLKMQTQNAWMKQWQLTEN